MVNLRAAEDLEEEALAAFVKLRPGFVARRDGEASQFAEVFWHSSSNVQRYFGRSRDDEGSWKMVAGTGSSTDCEAAYKLVNSQGKSLKEFLHGRCAEDWEAQMKEILPGLAPQSKPPSQFRVAYYHRTNGKGRWFGRSYCGNQLWECLGVGGQTDAEVVYKAAIKLGQPLKQFVKDNYLPQVAERLRMQKAAAAETRGGPRRNRRPLQPAGKQKAALKASKVRRKAAQKLAKKTAAGIRKRNQRQPCRARSARGLRAQPLQARWPKRP
jgi:hypothetical protein